MHEDELVTTPSIASAIALLAVAFGVAVLAIVGVEAEVVRLLAGR